jgi:hypothetical protein
MVTIEPGNATLGATIKVFELEFLEAALGRQVPA